MLGWLGHRSIEWCSIERYPGGRQAFKLGGALKLRGRPCPGSIAVRSARSGLERLLALVAQGGERDKDVAQEGQQGGHEERDCAEEQDEHHPAEIDVRLCVEKYGDGQGRRGEHAGHGASRGPPDDLRPPPRQFELHLQWAALLPLP